MAIEPLPYPFAALDWSAERSREEAEMWLSVSGVPPIDLMSDVREWPSDGPPGTGPLRHEYWAGTRGTAANDGGCKVGEFPMSVWTDATTHW